MNPYGMLMDGRHGQAQSDYRYGFQGQEKDDEVKGEGNSVNFGARFHDPRVGRWFSQDKVVKSALSPYQFAKNNGIIYVDTDGNDELYFTIHNAGTDNVYVEATYIKTADATLKIMIVTGDAVGIDPQALSNQGGSHPGVIQIKPYKAASFFPNQGSRIAASKKLPLAFDLRVQQALDDYSYMGKLIALTGNIESFEADINAAGAKPGVAEVLGGAAGMNGSMTATEIAGIAEGGVALGAVLIRKGLTKVLVKEGTEQLTKKATSSASKNLTRQSVDDKLARYLLNPDHPVGGIKAKWFKEALGFTKSNADDLAKQIVFDPKKAVQTAVTEHGTKFNQVISITGANGRTIDVTFAWIKNKDGVTRLVTSIPSNK